MGGMARPRRKKGAARPESGALGLVNLCRGFVVDLAVGSAVVVMFASVADDQREVAGVEHIPQVANFR